MSKSQRDKGKRLEREAAKLLECVIPGLERQQQARGGPKPPDLDTRPGMAPAPFRIEVSGGKAPSPHGKALQSNRDAEQADDPRPILVLTKRDRGVWLVSMWIGDWINVMAAVMRAADEGGVTCGDCALFPDGCPIGCRNSSEPANDCGDREAKVTR